MQHNIVIRMGASHWDATVNHHGTPVNFDFSAMSRDDRAAFHREFMAAFRENFYGKKPEPKTNRRRRYRRRTA